MPTSTTRTVRKPKAKTSIARGGGSKSQVDATLNLKRIRKIAKLSTERLVVLRRDIAARESKSIVGEIKIKGSTGGVLVAPHAFASIIHGSPVEVIKRTREGLPASVFGEISTYLDMPQTQLYDAVGVSRSTMAARIKANQHLSSSESDKVIRIAKVLERAADVLGDSDQARIWLRREIRSIGGVPPITLLDTEAGYELVLDTLGRIEQGIAA